MNRAGYTPGAMTLAPGARLGAYEITSAIGAGGMGEVFGARDTKLNRDVAIKVLPAALAQDSERVGRFRREAQILATLNHPNIAAIYGLEESAASPGSARADSGQAAVVALVMELVAGDDLAQRLLGGAIPVDEALAIAKQVAEALEEAHEHGIVHRDLKPANIKVTPEGKVKVLDFGLAKALEGERGGASSQLSHSPTMSRHATEAGLILGTAAYMSPEQARGKAVDKRADIWSFGVVLFEMLTGKRLFAGETVSDTLAAVLREEVPWPSLPAETPLGVTQLLKRCLARDPRQRLRDIGEARFALAAAEAPESLAVPRRRVLPAAILVGAVSVALGVLAGRSLKAGPPAESALTWLSVLPPPSGFRDRVDPALSPDGRTLVFAAPGRSGTPVLWLRDLGSPTLREILGSDDAMQPFWSPDGRWIAFFAHGKLKKVSVSGGSPEILADAPAGRGGTWNAGGDILFTPTSFVPIHRSTAGGGPATRLALPGDPPNLMERRAYAHFLPDGRHFLFSRGDSIVVGALGSNEVKEILPVGSKAAYAKGHLFFVRDGDLFAQPFDVDRLATGGEALKVADNIGWSGDTATGFAFAVSPSGVIAYWDHSLIDLTQLTWLDRAGRTLGTLGEPAEHQGIALSPDGRQVAVEMHESKGGRVSVWLIDVATGTRSRFTTYKGWTGLPLWSADSKRLLVTDFSDQFHILPIDGGPVREIKVGAGAKWPTAWSRDESVIVFTENRDTRDISMVRTDGSAPALYLRTPFLDQEGRLSPNGAWLGYSSTETGSSEVYIQSFPNPGRKVRISPNGGNQPVWRADGSSLFYLSREGSFMEVELSAEPSGLGVRGARALFQAPPVRTAQAVDRTQYAVSKDGQRFLFNIPVKDESPRAITVILNWKPDAKP